MSGIGLPGGSPPNGVSPALRPRRTDRTVSDEAWIRAFLHEAPYGIVAMAGGGAPYVNANLFVFDEEDHAIYFHTWKAGRTRREIDANPEVCFAVARMGRLLPARRVSDYSVEYASVLVFGSAAVVEDAARARRAQELQLKKYFPHKRPGRDFEPFTEEELARAAVYRLAIRGWSAKRNAADPDHAGAFRFPFDPGAGSETASTSAALPPPKR
jgi:nitroimidazol reductase NimA-like FMN-containing flavoprotein (pyridoxamine 5'-phosphate oxidase superfamily)